MEIELGSEVLINCVSLDRKLKCWVDCIICHGGVDTDWVHIQVIFTSTIL